MRETSTGKKLREALNSRQSAFAQAYVDGNTGKGAAITAGYSEHTAEAQASKLLRNVKVAAYISHLRQSTETEATLTRQRKRELLKKWAEDKDGSHSLQAIKIDNEMTGDNQAVRIEGEITLQTIMKSLSGSTGLPSED